MVTAPSSLFDSTPLSVYSFIMMVLNKLTAKRIAKKAGMSMRQFHFFRVLGAGLAVATVLFSTGCATRSDTHGIRPFGAVGAKADVYVFAPVSGNEPLLRTLFTAFVPKETAAQYLNRTSALYIGVQYGPAPEVTVVSAGSYPVSLSGLLFSKKDGWEKRRSQFLVNSAYYHSQAADVVLRPKTAFALLGNKDRNTDAFLQRITEAQQPAFPARFESLLSRDGAGETHAEIGVYIRSAHRIIAELAGLEDIELPVRSIEFYLRKAAGTTYRYSAVFETVNARTAAVLRLWVGSMLTGTLSIDGSALVMQDAEITEERLIDLLRSFHLNTTDR